MRFTYFLKNKEETTKNSVEVESFKDALWDAFIELTGKGAKDGDTIIIIGTLLGETVQFEYNVELAENGDLTFSNSLFVD